MENLKSKIIPESLKVNIDEIMERQLFNANRYYAESNPNISNLMSNEMNDSPEEFYHKLVERWNWHNCYYEELLEPAYEYLVREGVLELSPQEVEQLIKVYKTSCYVDEATLVMSASIKKYLDYNCSKIYVEGENISKEEGFNMLVTPPKETYFAQYQIDHLYYIYLLKKDVNKAANFKKYLKKQYHADDEVIFQSRFNKKFAAKINLSEEQLLKEIHGYSISKEYKTKHFYFTLEHPERRAIRDIIQYDNIDEKLIACNLIGISGFLLRRKILEYLNSSKILPNNGYIYEFNNEVVISSLENLRDEREKQMDKNVRPYKQRGDTCAIACMMMALEYYKVMEKANWYDERRLYRIYGSKYMIGTPFSAVAYHLAKNGLETAIYHEDENCFNNNLQVLNASDFDLAMQEYKVHLDRAKKHGASIINGQSINSELLKQKLEEGNLVILAGELGNIFHAILLTGYQDNNFIVCDPLYKNKRTISCYEIDNFMNTSIGKWFIAVGDKKREKTMLLDSLEKYETEAKDLLTDKSKGRHYVKE